MSNVLGTNRPHSVLLCRNLLSLTCYCNEEGRSPKRNADPEYAFFLEYLKVTELLLWLLISEKYCILKGFICAWVLVNCTWFRGRFAFLIEQTKREWIWVRFCHQVCFMGGMSWGYLNDGFEAQSLDLRRALPGWVFIRTTERILRGIYMWHVILREFRSCSYQRCLSYFALHVIGPLIWGSEFGNLTTSNCLTASSLLPARCHETGIWSHFKKMDEQFNSYHPWRVRYIFLIDNAIQAFDCLPIDDKFKTYSGGTYTFL
jgi:hypothetical protein